MSAPQTIAALFVDSHGCYANQEGVDTWDEKRDARLYAGPYPVVAHPPCARWCKLAGLAEWKYGLQRGEDGGCFASALESVRKWGGVLEHPAYTAAWSRFDLPRPIIGVWQRGFCGGWVAHVEQGHYGHRAKKSSWLYAIGVDLARLNLLTTTDARRSGVAWCLGRGGEKYGERPQLTKRERIATPVAFRDLLIAMARSAVTPA